MRQEIEERTRGARRVGVVATLLLLWCGCSAGRPPGETPLPSRFDWREVEGALPPVGDQGLSNSCVPWSLGYGSATFRLRRYLHPDWDLDLPENRISPSYLYNLAMAIRAEAGTEDTELEFVTAMDLMSALGVATERTMPYTVAYSRHPTQAAMDEAAALRRELSCIAQWESLSQSQWSAENWRVLKEKLVDAGPVLFMIKGYDDLDCCVGEDYVPRMDRKYKNRHALLCVGYDDHRRRASGGAEAPSFLVMNSWGTSWGSGGFLWIPYGVLVPSGDGADRMLVEVLAAGRPTLPCPTPPDLSRSLPEAWKGSPTRNVWPPELYDQCAHPPEQPVEETVKDLSLPPGEDRIEILSPAVPFVPALFGSRIRFKDATPVQPAAAPTYTLSPTTRAGPDAIGAWFEVADLIVTDRDAAPNPIIVTCEVERPNDKKFAKKTIRVFVR